MSVESFSRRDTESLFDGHRVIPGKRAITVDTGLRLSRFVGLIDGFWTGLQLDYDAARAKDELADVLANIKPMEVA